MSDAVTDGGAAPPANTAPWAADLAATFSDPDLQAQVDSFMREKVQPRVTQLEQQLAGLNDAQEYYNDLVADPGQTWVHLTHEILGEDLATKVLSALQDGETAEPAATGGEPPAASNLSPEDQALLAEIRGERQQNAYTQAVDSFCDETDAEGNKVRPDLKAKWFHPFVAAADGNLQTAYAGYQEWINDVKAGLTPGGTADAEATAAQGATAPPTLGSDTGGAPTPPIAKDYKGNLSAAIDDLFDDMRSAPSTMGSV